MKRFINFIKRKFVKFLQSELNKIDIDEYFKYKEESKKEMEKCFK